MGNRKLYSKSNEKFQPISSKTSFQIYPFFKKGDIVYICGDSPQIVNDIGLAICSSLSMNTNMFMKESVFRTIKFQKVLYINTGACDTENSLYVSDFVKNYIPGVGPNKPFNNQAPFAICNMHNNFFAVNFWKLRQSEKLRKEMFEYDIIVFNTFQLLFLLKQMKPVEVFEFLEKYRKKGITIVLIEPGDCNENSQLYKKSDIVVEVKTCESQTIDSEEFDKQLIFKKYKHQNKPKPIFIRSDNVGY